MNTKLFMILMFRVILFGFVAYIVFWKDASAWWFLGALLITPFYDGEIE